MTEKSDHSVQLSGAEPVAPWQVSILPDEDGERIFGVTLPNGKVWKVHALDEADALDDAKINWTEPGAPASPSNARSDVLEEAAKVADLLSALKAIRNAARKNRVNPDAIYEIADGAIRSLPQGETK